MGPRYYYEREFTEAYNTLGVLPPTVEPRATGHMSDMIDLIQRILDNGHGYVVTDADGKAHRQRVLRCGILAALRRTHSPEADLRIDEAAAVADRMARPWTPPVPTSTIRSTRPMPPPTSMIRVISPCGRLRRTPIPRTPVGRRRLAWAALAGTSNAPPCPTVTWAMASTFTAAAWICASPTTKTKWLRPVRRLPLAARWMHSAWVTAKGEKMSKSLGTGLSVPSVLAEHSAWVVRYALGSVQYRSMLEWSDQALVEAQAAYDRVSNFIERAGVALGGQLLARKSLPSPPTICPPISWPP